MNRQRLVWFWQRIVSPHMAGLAAALARQGCQVVYVANEIMSADRAQQGWTMPDLGDARLELAATAHEVVALVKTAPPHSIHICQGLRGNGLVGKAQRGLAGRGLRHWVVMETVDDHGWQGLLKRLEYWRLYSQWAKRLEGVLAIGHQTPRWVAARGMPPERIYPFAYFLPPMAKLRESALSVSDPFHWIFVGQFIELKRLDLLISALAGLNRTDFDLTVIGSGLLEGSWRAAAEAALPGRVHWIGRLPMHDVLVQLAAANCLVLPSRYDGWGAVVSEALMTGTPAICSDQCGAAGVVRASGYGGVFQSGQVKSLADQLLAVLERGRLSSEARFQLADWAQCLGADMGVVYLRQILEHRDGHAARPSVPWESRMPEVLHAHG